MMNVAILARDRLSVFLSNAEGVCQWGLAFAMKKENGRGGRTRTGDLLNPIQTR